MERLHYAYFFGQDAELGPLRLSHSFEHTLWAMALVRSRTFGLTIAAEPVSVMAPYLDLANHSDNFACSFRASHDEYASGHKLWGIPALSVACMCMCTVRCCVHVRPGWRVNRRQLAKIDFLEQQML